MYGQLLMIEDEPQLRSQGQRLLASAGYAVSVVADAPAGLACLRQQHYDVVITDPIRDGAQGVQMLEYLAASRPETLVIVITAHPSMASALAALRHGVHDYLPKPWERTQLLASLERAMVKVQRQQSVQQALAGLQVMQQQLRHTEKFSALEELITGFAHELNNPLTSVVGYAELLAEAADCPADVCRMLERICQEAARCHRIVQNLLSFARQTPPEKDYIDVGTLCLKTLDLLSYQFKVHNIATVTNFAPALPWTMADSHQLQQALVNILSNAYHAMADQPCQDRLTLTTSYDQDWIYITITDTGPGIPAANVHRIFDPFFTTKPQGTGLGLSLAYGVVKEHGGELLVKSPPGAGATFIIQLPILSEARLAPQRQPAVRAAMPVAKQVLVIDDEPAVAQVLVATLQCLGYHAEAVYSGQEASDQIAARMPAQPYDLILCDMQMPQMDGRQFYGWIASQYPSLLQRLLFSSGDTMRQEHQQFVQETGCLLLPKPFVRADLLQCLAQIWP